MDAYNIAAIDYHNEPSREQFLALIMPTKLWIKNNGRGSKYTNHEQPWWYK